ncbi:MAG: hypothetical protein AMXMBFR47_19990 [Planctomycetota bacterium]
MINARIPFCLGALAAYAAAQTPATVVAKVGDAVGNSTISTLNAPFTNGLGQVGFVAALADSTRIVWIGNGPVFNSADALPDVLTGGEGTMGISDAGGFVYSPSFNGNDAVYTHLGLLLADGDPAPGMPGMFSSFNSRPTMTPDGTANWVGGWSATAGGSTVGRIFYSAAGSNPANTTILLKTGDIVDGFPIGTSGIGFGYDVADNNLHRIHALILSTGSTNNDDCIWVDGAVVARELSPTGQGDNWDNFTSMGINNNGDYVFTGDTDGNIGTDAFIAYNGQIVLRETDAVGGTQLAGTCRWISISNNGKVAFIHDSAAGEALFYGDATDLANATLVAAVGASLDTNGDSIGDETLTDFEASGTIGPGLSIGDDEMVYVEVELNDGTTAREAIIGFDVGTTPPCRGDLDGDGDVDIADLAILLSGFGGIGPVGDFDADGDVDISDLAILLSAFGTVC